MLVCAPAAAQQAAGPSPLMGALAACRAIADAGARLNCFDRASANLLAATQRGDISIVDRGQLRQARRSLFGFGMPKLPFFAGDKSVDDVPDKLTSKVTAVRSVGYDRYQVRIEDGGALWETTESYGSFRAPTAGESVEIRRGPLGSYILRFGRQRGVKGKRVG